MAMLGYPSEEHRVSSVGVQAEEEKGTLLGSMLVLGWALLALLMGQEEAGGPEERPTKGRREV